MSLFHTHDHSCKNYVIVNALSPGTCNVSGNIPKIANELVLNDNATTLSLKNSGCK